MYELGVVANGGVVVPFNNPVNEVEILVDDPIAPVNALKPDNHITVLENSHVPANGLGFWKWMMICFIVGMMYGQFSVSYMVLWYGKDDVIDICSYGSCNILANEIGICYYDLHTWCTLEKYNHEICTLDNYNN